MPIAKYKQDADEPPTLKKGRVTPITGNKLKHIPKLKIVCDIIIPIIPKHIKDPSSSPDFLDIYPILKTADKIKKIKNKQPKKPSSSPTAENIKSLS